MGPQTPLHARHGPGVVGLLALWLVSPAYAQLLPPDVGTVPLLQSPALLPDTGIATSSGNLRQQVEQLDTVGPAKNATLPGWNFTPSLTLRQEWTNQVQGADIGSSFVTVLQPGILANGDTPRLHAVLDYTPDLELFSASGAQNQVGQNFNANALVTMVPERLFLDLRGFGTVQSSDPGLGPTGTLVLSRQSETQVQFYSVRPYLRERFSDWVTAEVGASVSYVSQQGLASNPPTPLLINSTNQDSTTKREYVSLESGPQLGRVSLNGLVSALQSYGTGVLSGAYRNEADVEGGFAISRDITILAGGGLQNIHYGGFPNYNFTGPQWDAGVRWAPNADSTVTIRYGRKDGVVTPQIEGAFAPSARTRVYLRYSEGITTDQEQLQTAINESVLDPLGNAVDAETGSPLLLINNFYGVQSNLSRLKRGSLTGTLIFDRDTLSLSVGEQKSQQLAAASAAAAGDFNSTAVYGAINWQHEFVGQVTSTTFFQYGTTDRSALRPGLASPAGTSVIFSLSLSFPVLKTLDGLLEYAYTRQPGSGTSGTLPANLVVVGIRKVF